MIKLTKIILSIFLILFAAIFIIFLVRAFSEKQIDDVSPDIPCSPDLLEKSDVFYVIPMFENKSIAENKTWCQEILAMNKTLALHGVYHTYNEFLEPRNAEYIQEGISAFKECFGFEPERFKPPQMRISLISEKHVKEKMRLDFVMNSVFHKAYHCNDSGIISNRIMDIF